jgi:hypothetical protein
MQRHGVIALVLSPRLADAALLLRTGRLVIDARSLNDVQQPIAFRGPV